MIGFLSSLLTDNDDDVALLIHLYVQHYKLWRYKVTKIIRDNDVDDIIHDVIINMIPKLSFLKNLPPVKQLAYVATSLENAAKKQINYRDRVIVTDDIESYIPSSANDPYTVYDQKITSQAFYHAMEQLSERNQNLIYYKYFEELPDETIALLLNIQKASIRSALTRARRDLRAKLDKENKNE